MSSQDRRLVEHQEAPDMAVAVAPDMLLVVAAEDFRIAIALDHVLVPSVSEGKVGLFVAAY